MMILTVLPTRAGKLDFEILAGSCIKEHPELTTRGVVVATIALGLDLTHLRQHFLKACIVQIAATRAPAVDSESGSSGNNSGKDSEGNHDEDVCGYSV